MSQQFSDNNLAQLSGARIVRLAVHLAVQGIMELLYRYHNGELMSLSSGVDDDDMCNKGEEDDDVSSETPSESDDSEDEPNASNALLHKEALKPRKKLPRYSYHYWRCLHRDLIGSQLLRGQSRYDTLVPTSNVE